MCHMPQPWDVPDTGTLYKGQHRFPGSVRGQGGDEGKGFLLLEMGVRILGRQNSGCDFGGDRHPAFSQHRIRPACRSRASCSILPSSSSPPVGFLKPQSESVPPTWLLVPGALPPLSGSPRSPAVPRGSCCTPTPLQSSCSGARRSLSCGGEALGFFALSRTLLWERGWGGYKPGLREGTMSYFLLILV